LRNCRSSRTGTVALATALSAISFALPAAGGLREAALGAAGNASITISIGSASIVASEKGQPTVTFPVTLSKPATTKVTVSYRTQDGTGRAGRDYDARSGRITFGVDKRTGLTRIDGFVAVAIRPRSSPGGARDFTVRLSNANGANLGNAVGAGTIAPRIRGNALRASAGDMRVFDGAGGGTRMALMRVTLSRPAAHLIAVKYKITGGTAKAKTHFVGPTAGTVWIQPKALGGWVPVKLVSGSVGNAPVQLLYKLTGATSAVISRSTGIVTIVPELSVVSPPPPPPPPPPPGGLVFDDEFNGTSLDASKWEGAWYGSNGPVNGAETACYDPKQNSVSGGYLHMTAVKSGSCGMTYATGFVDSRQSFTFTTGTLTFRAFLPGDSSGVYNWPALWTDGTGTWPQTGESDVMEGLSGHATCTYHSPSGGQGCNAGGSSGWHTYGETVTPGKVVYSYDGQVVGTVTNSTVGYHPHFIIMSNQMGQYGGKAVVPSEMLVDWVRVSK
jgi:hypothetical protein